MASPAFAQQDYTEAQLNDLFRAGGDGALTASDYVVRHPELVTPLSLGNAMVLKWKTGERLQAAFVLYLYQIRMMPWAAIVPDMKDFYEDQMDVAGVDVDDWASSDFEAWRKLVRRAIAYERKAPLYAKHAGEMSDADWSSLIGKAREIYAGNFEQAFGTMTAEKAGAMRTGKMLYVGPWKDPGKPLPDSWA